MPRVADSLARAALSVPEWAIISWPGSLGRRLRAAYWKQRLGGMGRRCAIDVGVVIQGPENVFLGDDVWLDNYCVLVAGPPAGGPARRRVLDNPRFRGERGQIHIGDRCHVSVHTVLQGHGGLFVGSDVNVGTHSMIYSQSHHYRDDEGGGDPDDYASVPKYVGSPTQAQVMIEGPVELGDGCAVLGGSMVLPGSAVGRLSVVGPGSLVKGEVPPGVIAGGNPLRIVKQRFGRPIDP